MEFSEREITIIKKIIKGETYREIGKDMFLSTPTIKVAVGKIARKIGVKRKLQIITYVINNKIIEYQDCIDDAEE